MKGWYCYWSVCEGQASRLAAHVIALGNERGIALSGEDALSFAAQMLCGNPNNHRSKYHRLWQRKGHIGWHKASIVSSKKGYL